MSSGRRQGAQRDGYQCRRRGGKEEGVLTFDSSSQSRHELTPRAKRRLSNVELTALSAMGLDIVRPFGSTWTFLHKPSQVNRLHHKPLFTVYAAPSLFLSLGILPETLTWTIWQTLPV